MIQGTQGIIAGNIEADEARLGGTVEGTVVARTLIVEASARILGAITRISTADRRPSPRHPCPFMGTGDRQLPPTIYRIFPRADGQRRPRLRRLDRRRRPPSDPGADRRPPSAATAPTPSCSGGAAESGCPISTRRGRGQCDPIGLAASLVGGAPSLRPLLGRRRAGVINWNGPTNGDLPRPVRRHRPVRQPQPSAYYAAIIAPIRSPARKGSARATIGTASPTRPRRQYRG